MIAPTTHVHGVRPATAGIIVKQNRWTRYATGAVSGIVLGILFPIFGGFLTATDTAHGQGHILNFYLGAALLFLTLPLLIFGICCLFRVVDDSIPASYRGPVRFNSDPGRLNLAGISSHRTIGYVRIPDTWIWPR
jgi:hypothetical protein